MRGYRIKIAAGFLLMVFAAGTFLFPHICDQMNRIRTLTEACASLDETDFGGYEEADAYNEKIARLQAERPFAYAGAEAGEGDMEYRSIPAGGSDILCCVEVPSADICLPVGHGTREQTLAHEAGHMYGTSVPTGGESVHAVIAAHTGLAGARLFTDLADVTFGDLVLIHLGEKTLHYRVDAVNVVRPEEESRYLQIIPGEDYVTLYTCTPIGKNTHRLLVRAKRSSLEETSEDPAREKAGLEAKRDRAFRRLCLYGAAVILLPLGLCILFGRGSEEHFRKRSS